jgi:Icc-related predicted phosphoesterase
MTDSMLTRIFFTSDVHGSEVCFMKFINAAKFYKANVLILGGDITGKMIIPVVEQKDGTAVADFLGEHLIIRTKEERLALEKNIRNNGFYPYSTTPDEVEKLQADKKLVDTLFSETMAAGIRRWVAIAEGRLKGTNVKCYISPGNDDRFDIDPILKSSSTVLYPEDEVVSIDEHHEMITSAWSNPSPWNSPREAPEAELINKFGPMVEKVQKMENAIFNFHVPPYDTIIDVAPELDASLRPVIKAGTISLVHVGSITVRQLIEKYQPLLGLHGHIHESRGCVKIGRTLCLNPGSEYGEGILRGLLINLDEKRLKNYMFTSG